MRAWWLAGSTIVALALWPSTARAEADGPGWAFNEPAADAVIVAVGAASLASTALPQLEYSDWEPNPIRPHHPGYGYTSDFVGGVVGTFWQFTAGFAMEAGYYDDAYAAEPYERAARSSLVEAEAVLLTSGATLALKRVVGRCRPRSFRNGGCAGRDWESFPSGHVSPIAAIAGTRLTLALRTDGPRTRRLTSFALAEACSIATAFLRVLAGAHSIEDVAVGWGLGHAVGVGVAFAHPMEPVPLDLDVASQTSELRGEVGYGWHF